MSVSRATFPPTAFSDPSAHPVDSQLRSNKGDGFPDLTASHTGLAG